MTGVSESRVCPSCSALVTTSGALCSSCYSLADPVTIRVEGVDAEEVSRVTRDLLKDFAIQHEVRKLRSPWVSGTFYLAAVIVVIALLLVVTTVAPAWALPLVIIGAVLLVAVVGALQLRQDDQLSDEGFVKLMSETLRRLPVVWSRGGTPSGTGTSSSVTDP